MSRLAALGLLGLVSSLGLSAYGQPVVLKSVATGLDDPVAVEPAGDGSGWLFIVEQQGLVKVFDGNAVLSEPFLDIRDLVGCCGERGLLGIAFHPDYAVNGRFFVNYTNNDFDTVIARYEVGDDPRRADTESQQVLLTVDQPFSNHNGGQLAFGPDGYLYVGMGDGGSSGDPQNNAQNPMSLLGKMLRLDVDSGQPYAIPPDNPFAADDFTRDEIWANGLRNPFRFSFDRVTGDLFIADVGQNQIEEVSLHLANTPAGENFGWRRMEGSQCFNPASGCNDGSLTLPIFEYGHTGGRCSVTGGYRYRGTALQHLQGAYLYGDFCSGEIFAASLSVESGWSQSVLLNTTLRISTFGQDDLGELYVADLEGGLYRIAAPVSVAPGSGTYLDAHVIDLSVIVRGQAPVDLADIEVTLNGIDITQIFAGCAQVLTLAEGGTSFTCPAVPLSVLEPGVYSLHAGLIGGGAELSNGVTWEILSTSP